MTAPEAHGDGGAGEAGSGRPRPVDALVCEIGSTTTIQQIAVLRDRACSISP